MNRIEATMDDLPELPFEQILLYLSVEDRLMARSVSRSWRQKFDFEVKSLFFSKIPAGYLIRQPGLISGPFAANFMSSTRFDSFFNTFRESVLCGLKRLRLCKLDLNESNGTAFAQVLNSFQQLEELALFRFAEDATKRNTDIELKLPVLHSIHLENIDSIRKLTIDSPALRKVRVMDCTKALKVHFVHGDSVEQLEVEYPDCVEIERLINLEVLYTVRNWSKNTKGTLLAYLKNLKEIWLGVRGNVADLFRQNNKYKRELKIYLCGLLLNGPNDPNIASLCYHNYLCTETFACLCENMLREHAENMLRVAERIQLLNTVVYVPDMDPNLVGKFVDLDCLLVTEKIVNVSKFLEFLETFPQISCIEFEGEQSLELFDHLSEHSAVQWMVIYRPPQNSQFLLGLKRLVSLSLHYAIDLDFVQTIFGELQYLTSFEFQNNNKKFTIDLTKLGEFRVLSGQKKEIFSGASLNAAIEFIRQPNKRKFALVKRYPATQPLAHSRSAKRHRE